MIKHDGFNAIFKSLDLVEAERFVVLLKRDDFDYTDWRKDLWENLTVEELSKKAAQFSSDRRHK